MWFLSTDGAISSICVLYVYQKICQYYKRETSIWEKYISYLPGDRIQNPGMCPDGNRTCDRWVCRMTLQPMIHTSEGHKGILTSFNLHYHQKFPVFSFLSVSMLFFGTVSPSFPKFLTFVFLDLISDLHFNTTFVQRVFFSVSSTRQINYRDL